MRPSLPRPRRDSAAVSPTAHYTGQVWTRNDLSHPALATLEGRLMFESLRPLMVVSGALGGVTLEGYLLARHRALDELLARAIEDDGVGQVIEVACGMSARGWRFVTRYPELVYIEADLPGMAARKQAALASIGTLGERHRVVPVDALAVQGCDSLAAVAAPLDPDRGLVVICEGLLGYLERSLVEDLWRRIAALLGNFAVGAHLSDLHLRGEQTRLMVRAFRLGLSAFVRGQVHLHYSGPLEAQQALLSCGFRTAEAIPSYKLASGDAEGGAATGGRLSTVIRARV